MDDLKKRTWAEIDYAQIAENFKAIKSHVPEETRFCGVVKADAYGHGAVNVARLLEKEGADYLAVACIDEAVELREQGLKLPILILGYTPACYARILIENDITQALGSQEMAEEYAEQLLLLGRKLRIHIKVDTGMSRTGFTVSGSRFDEEVGNIAAICRMNCFDAEGIFTHFAVSDEPGEDNKEYTLGQFDLFMKTIEALKEHGMEFKIRHCANTGATVNYPEMALDMVRPGFLLYGYGDPEQRIGVKPCMRFVTTVSAIKYYDPKTSISYGRKFVTERITRVAVLACGYADGLPRAASGKCSFVTGAGEIKQVGNICMDMCMADATLAPDLKVGSEVEIFGKACDIQKLADAAYTIPYELLCSVSRRVPRVKIEEV